MNHQIENKDKRVWGKVELGNCKANFIKLKGKFG